MNSQAATRHKQGPKPASLMINRNSTKISKQKQHLLHHSPVIVYLKSPNVIHVRPEEFMSLVQQLTGNPESAAVVAVNSPKMEKSSTVAAMDENPIEDFIGSIGRTANISVDFQALMHFVDFV